MRPHEIARTLQIVNGAKRRGAGAPERQQPTHVIALNLPTTIQNRFTLNSPNQVVRVGVQDLVTIPSAAVPKLLEKHNEPSTPSTDAKELGFE